MALLPILASLFAIGIAVVAIVFLIVPLFKGIAWFVSALVRAVGAIVMHVFRFVAGMIGDTVRMVGAIITAIVFLPLILGSVVIGRWSTAMHFGRGFQDEVLTFGRCLYRVCIGHLARFLLLHGLTEGIENRVPDAMAQSPGADKPSRRTGQFPGYTVVGSLAGGGSGGRLFVADPDESKRAAFARSGTVVDQVVIKSFSLQDGSSLPQIIRESRALESAKKLGLILDHELDDERFYYAMPYVPGDNLTVVTKRLHAESGPRGLERKQLAAAMSHMTDLLKVLAIYHRGGLWHKDVKPDNIIIAGGQAHLVDLGLVTPLRSAMTLTTHGTEYFRDPEMVRMALRGAKVREVDGVKFDLYGAGAVTYAVVENNFPAHGALSQFSRKSPEALRWIIRRSMAEMSKRYGSADEMLADLRVVMEADDPYAVKPAELPSVLGGAAGAEAVAAVAQDVDPEGFRFGPDPQTAQAERVARAGSPVPPFRQPKQGVSPLREGTAPAAHEAKPSAGRQRPRLQVTDWITGRYRHQDDPAGAQQPHDKEGGPFVFVAGIGSASAKAEIRRAAQEARRAAKEARQAVRQALGMSPRAPEPPASPMPAHTPGARRPAHEQLARARARAHAAQKRVRGRGHVRRYNNRPNAGVVAATLVLLGVVVVIPLVLATMPRGRNHLSGILDDVRDSLGDGFTISLGDKTIRVNRNGSSRAIASTAVNIDTLNDLGRAYASSGRWESFAARFEEDDDHEGAWTDDHTVDSGDQGRYQSLGGEHPSTWPAVGAATASPLRGSILLLNLLPADVEEKNAGEIDEIVTTLIRGGFRVLGLGDSEREIGLLAAGKNIVGISNTDDAASIERLRRWLTNGDDGLDAALWIAPGKDRDVVSSRLVVRPAFDPDSILRVLARD